LGAPNSWEQIGDAVPARNPDDPDAYRLVVDPWLPCRVYRVAGDGRRLERSVDGAKTWTTVFFDGRTSNDTTTAAPAHLNITGIYVPAPATVYISENGNGVGVARSRDAGASWEPANGGLTDKPVKRLWFAPSNVDVAYAAVPTGGTSSKGVGAAIAFFATRNGGATWQALTAAQFVNVSDFSATVDPSDAAHVYIGTSGLGFVAGSVIRESHDYGQSFQPLPPFDGDMPELIAARRPSGGLRLYRLTNGNPRGIKHSDDDGATWVPVTIDNEARWFGGIVDPMNQDKVLYFGLPRFQGRSSLLALYTRNGFVNQEYGEQPPLTTRNYDSGGWGVDRFGQFYVDVGVYCQTVRCDPNGAPDPNGPWRAWRTLRFRPPDPGQAFVIGAQPPPGNAAGGSITQAHACTVAARPPDYPRSAEEDDAGSLGFGGGRLYYTRRAETGPDPYASVIRIADPVTCQETGRLVVHFDPGTYQDARKRAISDEDNHPLMLPERPSVDSVAYDAVHDELWLSVTRVAETLPPYSGEHPPAPFPVWAVPRSGVGDDRHAELRFWTEPCSIGGVGLLAHDRGSDSLWTCDGKVPGELLRSGTGRATCLHPLFQGSAAEGTVWKVFGWGVSLPGTLVALRDDSTAFPPRRVEQYNARTCTHTASWSVGVADHLIDPRQGPEWVSKQIVCDPLTFRERLNGAPAPPAVAWMRRGPRFVAFTAPGLACPSPTALGYTGAAGVRPGTRLDACATVTVPGPAVPLPHAPVRISVAGGPARMAASDANGKACVPFDVPANTAQGTRLTVKAEVVEDAHLLGSTAVGSVLVGQVPVSAAPPFLPPPLIPKPPPPIPFPPAPAPAPAPQPGVQAAATPPGQPVTQQGMADEKEREIQLAHAQQESSAEERAQIEAPAMEAAGDGNDFAFVAVAAGAIGMAALGLGLATSRSPVPSPATAVLTEPVVDRRRKPRHRRRR
jgi:hypothetical protein